MFMPDSSSAWTETVTPFVKACLRCIYVTHRDHKAKVFFQLVASSCFNHFGRKREKLRRRYIKD